MENVLAVDLGGTKTAVGIVDPEGRVLTKETIPTPLGDPRKLVAAIQDLSRVVIARAGSVRALGMAMPGIADLASPVLRASLSSVGGDVPFARMIGETLSLPVSVDNDMNACALAEARFGSGRSLDAFFWFQVGTGIGGAVFSGGRVLAGAHSMAGGIGHLMVNPGGEPCGCGHLGCLEAEAADPAWRRKALRRLDALFPRATGFLSAIPRGEVDGQAVVEGAHSGDPLCLDLVREVGSQLARGIAAVINILDPQAIIFGGDIADSLDLLLPVIEEESASLIFARTERSCPILGSSLGFDAVLVGAAALALSKL